MSVMKSARTKEKGAVLVIALIFLILLTLVGISGMDSGTLELRMASNEEEHILAFQTAQAAVDQVTEKRSHFLVTGNPGDAVNCTSNCTNVGLTLTGSAFSNNDKVVITRLFPETGPPPRSRNRASSALLLESAFFQARAEHNTSGSERGYAAINQGYLVLIPKP